MNYFDIWAPFIMKFVAKSLQKIAQYGHTESQVKDYLASWLFFLCLVFVMSDDLVRLIGNY